MADDPRAFPAEPAAAAPDVAAADKPRVFTFRALLLGTLLALTVNLLTPYNDYVVANTFLVGSYLPLAVILAAFGLVIVGNSLYRAALPDKAFRTGEMSLVLLMLLVSCSFPSQGLMRCLLPSITSPFYHGQTSPTYWDGFLKAGLPGWLFPVSPLASGRSSDVIAWFYAKVPDGEAVPYRAWLVPLGAWGVFFGAFFALLACIAYILRIQWGERERLPFPLAHLQFALIEPPEPGFTLNRLFRARSFWIVTAIVFVLRSSNALHLYDPRFPELLTNYDFKRVLTEKPWSLLAPDVLKCPIYFTFIGMAFFIRARVAFSIWAIYLMMQVYALVRNQTGATVSLAETYDMNLGACVAFAVGMLFVGRALFWQVIRGALGLRTDLADRGAILAARIGLVALVVMFGWFAAIGASVWISVTTVALMLLAHVVTTRLVAETGLPFLRTGFTVLQVATLPDASVVSPRDVVIAGTFTQVGTAGTRESIMGFAQHGMRVMDEAGATPTRQPWKLAVVLLWTILLSFTASSWSSLACYYHYVTPITPRSTFTVLNQDMTLGQTKTNLAQPMEQQQAGAFQQRPYSVATQFTVGFLIVTALQIGTWSLASWPLLPVGFLMAGTNYIGVTWFSVLLGWLAKVVLVKCGGARALDKMRPAFVGMIFGESLAAATWALVSLILAANGYDYRPYSALPT